MKLRVTEKCSKSQKATSSHLCLEYSKLSCQVLDIICLTNVWVSFGACFVKFERIQNINLVIDFGNVSFQLDFIFWFRSTKLFLIVGGVALIAQFVRAVGVMLMKLISCCVIFVTSVFIHTVWRLHCEKYQLAGGNVNGKLFSCLYYSSIKCQFVFFLISFLSFPFHFAKMERSKWSSNSLSQAAYWLNFHLNWSLEFQVLLF